MTPYFAGSVNEFGEAALVKCNVNSRLRSFIEFPKDRSKIKRFERMFLDSGAFTAFTIGKVINIDEYGEFVKEYKAEVSANLDVIGDFDASRKNYEYLHSIGAAVIPVIHHGATDDQIRYWLGAADYVAIGGLVPYAKKRAKLRWFLDRVFKIALEEFWPKKLHLFGIWSDWCLLRYPAYSADSTSWLAFTRYGSTKVKIDPDMEVPR